MSSALRRSTRAKTGPQRAAQHNTSADCALCDELLFVPDYRDLLLRQLDSVTLARLRVCKDLKAWVDAILTSGA